MDEVRVYNRVLSPTEVQELFDYESRVFTLGFCPAFTLNGIAGESYVIQSTTNLADTNAWVTLTNLTLTQPEQLWLDTSVDATAPANARVFYRVLPGQ